MYFNFEDYRPETPTIEPAISRREGVLLSVVFHAVALALVLFAPSLPVFQAVERARLEAIQRRLEQDRARQDARFVFVQPRLDTPAPVPPDRADLSDLDRRARTRERPPEATNPLPYMRGNSPERVEAQPEARAAGRGEAPDPGAPEPGSAESSRADPGSLAYEGERQASPAAPNGAPARGGAAGGSLGDALRNLRQYVQNQSFENPQGGGGELAPWIQFDTKGVEFGPWIRRFVAQIKRNWFIPYAAMSLRGHVVITFNVHKDGSITDLTVVGPSDVDAFNNAAFNALLASTPTQPLPPEYPADKAFFTVTFFYNEMPPSP